MREHVLVTGGSGYLGRVLVERLLKRGYTCRIFDVNPPEDCPDDVEVILGDIRDYHAVQRACRDVAAVFHNVAQVPLAKDRHLFQDVNVGGTDHLLKASLEAGVRKVVHTSSSAIYGVPRSNPVTEETTAHPLEAYGAAKYEAELLCRRYAEQGLDVSVVRPRTIVGPGRLGIFQILFEWIREGVNIPVLGRGANVYQFVHADDLADACILAAERPGASAYNCGTDRFGTMRELLERLCAHAGSRSRVRPIPMAMIAPVMTITSKLGLSPLGDYHTLMYGRSMFFDVSKAENELGWRPQYSNEEMFVQAYDWYVANRTAVLQVSGASPHRQAVKQGVLRLLRWFL